VPSSTLETMGPKRPQSASLLRPPVVFPERFRTIVELLGPKWGTQDMNPYVVMPLPVTVKINWNFIPKPEPIKAVEKLETEQAVRDVRRALNAWLYSQE